MPTYLIIIIDLLVLTGVSYLSYKGIQAASKKKIEELENEAKTVLENAKRDAEATKKESILEAKEEVHRLRTDLDRDSRDRRNELQRFERRLIQREELLDKKSDTLQKKDDALNERSIEIDNMEVEVKELAAQRRADLEKIAGLSSEEARQLLLEEIKKEITHDTALMVKEIESRAKEEADKKAREIVTTAIQRCAADHVSETTVHVVSLPNDEMKGRIIGREGRNIRTLETLTGVDLIIDDTPEAVILSRASSS